MKIRLLTYNIRGARGLDGRRDYARIGHFLKQQRVDVALIQEMDTRYDDETMNALRELCASHFGDYVAAPTLQDENRWYGNALLSRFPVDSHRILDISVPGREPRNILEVFLRTPWGPLHVVNTHKGLSSAERRSQMRKLNELLKRESQVPLIVGGDINQWHPFARGLHHLNAAIHPLPSAATFPTRFPLFILDRFWCRPQSLVQKVRVLKTPETRLYSDHFPLLAEVDLSTTDEWPRPMSV